MIYQIRQQIENHETYTDLESECTGLTLFISSV